MRYLFFLIILVPSVAFSQISFDDLTDQYYGSTSIKGCNAAVSTDINGDGFEDLVLLDRAQFMYIGYSNGNSFDWIEGPQVSSAKEYICLFSDLDGDGQKELITSGSYSDTKIYEARADGNFRFDRIIRENFFAQGGNVVDVNNDGHQDLFICNDDGDNFIGINDGEGNLDVTYNIMDWNTLPPSDNSGNYASEWADINNDGLLDLSIAKCRLGVTDPEDPRRINRLYVQQPDGSFIDEAEERGVANGFQSWTTSLFDYDNDGDIDQFITNHDGPHQLYRNDGNGFFEEVNIFTETPENFSFQSLIADFNNDGWQDIYVSGEGSNILLINEKGNQFKVVTNPLGSSPIATMAIAGDWNNDGWIDLNTSYPSSINIPGRERDRLYINTSSFNHNYLKVELEGTLSNRLGTGAHVSVYSPSFTQTKVVKVGESYGLAMNNILHFGLGSDITVDSIVVRWPSGEEDTYFTNLVNGQILLKEGSCTGTSYLFPEINYSYCGFDFSIQNPPGYVDYLWNGQPSDSLNISAPGIYRLVMTDSSGCKVNASPIIVNDGSIKDDLILNTRNIFCNTENVDLLAYQGLDSYLWSTGDTTRSISVAQNGNYFLSSQDKCGRAVSDSIELSFIDPSDIIATGDTVPINTTAKLTIEGGETVRWYLDEMDNQVLATGDTFFINNLQSTMTLYAENTMEVTVNSGQIGESFDAGNVKYDNFQNFSVFINAYTDVMLSSVVVVADTTALRRLLLIDMNNDTLNERMLMIEEGVNQLNLDFNVPEGLLHRLVFDEEHNKQFLNSKSPRLAYKEIPNGQFPYLYENALDFLAVQGFSGVYPYFFSLQVVDQTELCISPRIPITAFLDTDVSSIEFKDDVKVYPNPTTGTFKIKGLSQYSRLLLFDAVGNSHVLMNENNQLSINHLSDGLYFILDQDHQIISSILKKSN